MSDGPPPVSAAEDQTAAPRLPVRASTGGRFAGRRRDRSPYAERFRAATAILIGLGIAAIVVAVTILVSPGSSAPSFIWSSWSPPDGGLTGETEIANEIAPFYRSTPSTQLVIVTAQNYSGSSSGTGSQVAIRGSNGSLNAVSGATAVYSLCGLGPGCAISGGTPSSQRELLLRREALQLALYTFKYISGIDNVVALLPPAHPAQQLTKKPPTVNSTASTPSVNLAVAFQKGALREFLTHPLAATLPEQLPPTVDQMSSAPEAELVSVITGQALFTQQIVHSQSGGSVLVLTPLPPQ